MAIKPKSASPGHRGRHRPAAGALSLDARLQGHRRTEREDPRPKSAKSSRPAFLSSFRNTLRPISTTTFAWVEWRTEELGLRQGPELRCRRQAARRSGGRPPHGIRRLRGHHPQRPVRRRHRHGVGPGYVGAASGLSRRRRGLRAGSLKFILHGEKLQGKWALIRMGGKAANEKKPNWLLIKEHDDFERKSDDPPSPRTSPTAS